MKKLSLFLFLAAATTAFAGEGMWMPQQIPQIAAEVQKAGIKIDPNRLADLTGDPMGAVISLGGCTASFVSPDGLIVTNHHCAFGSVQYNSSKTRDLITNGFLANTREEELPAAPGTKVWVTTKIEDVTGRMLDKLDKAADADRAKSLDRRTKELVAECEKPGGLRCRVAPFFEGSQYLRFTQAELSDIKLVYAPARAIGEFGGEVDNFEWPRHTGDWSFFRAYANGQPYHPAHWLKVSTDGVNPGDFVLVAGYPGRTFRYKTADEVRNYRDFVYPVSIRYYTDIIDLLDKASKSSKDVEIINSARIKSLANSLKNYTSVNEGFTKDRILEARLAREEKLRKAIAADASLGKYAPNLDEIAKLNAEHFRTRERDNILGWLISTRVSPELAQAYTVARVATEKPKTDLERMSGYQERDFQRLVQASDRAQRTFDTASDRAALRYMLAEASRLPADQRIKPIDDAVAAAGGLDAYLDKLYAGTKIGEQAERTKMYNETWKELDARNDAMLQLAKSLVPLVDANEARDRAYDGAMARLRPGYFEALRRVSGGTLYPDANGTLRITFGKVEGYSPRDATVYTPQTSLSGVLQKETGKEPFASPAALLTAARDESKTKPWVDPELHDVPVNFTSTCDTTGGNSGSPTLNAKGELVGLLFDGNYESIDADFLFNPAVTRSIHVDTNYMLWVMDAVDHAHNLMHELGVEARTK